MAIITKNSEKLTTESSGEKVPEKAGDGAKAKGAASIDMPGGTPSTAGVGFCFFKHMSFPAKKRTVLWLEGVLLVFCLTVMTMAYLHMDDDNDEVIAAVGDGLADFNSTGLNDTVLETIKSFGLAFPLIEKKFKSDQLETFLAVAHIILTFWLLASGVLGGSKWKLRAWMVIVVVNMLLLLGGWCFTDPSDDMTDFLHADEVEEITKDPLFNFSVSLTKAWFIIMRVLAICLVFSIITEIQKGEDGEEQKEAEGGGTNHKAGSPKGKGTDIVGELDV